MSRHRDVRCMNYSDEYDGYDDVYGHSVEDDYCVSPGAEQFMYDRNKQANISSFITEPNIAEGNEEELEDASYKTPSLSELETAKLMSCIDSIRNVIGDSITESELKKRIIELDYNTEAVLDAILNSASSKKTEEQTPNKRYSDFPLGLSLNKSAFGSKSELPGFTIPKLNFQKKSNFDEAAEKPKMSISSLSNFKSLSNLNSSNVANAEKRESKTISSSKDSGIDSKMLECSSLSSLIANHKKSNLTDSTPKTNQSTTLAFNSLSDLTSHHLKKSSSSSPFNKGQVPFNKGQVPFNKDQHPFNKGQVPFNQGIFANLNKLQSLSLDEKQQNDSSKTLSNLKTTFSVQTLDTVTKDVSSLNLLEEKISKGTNIERNDEMMVDGDVNESLELISVNSQKTIPDSLMSESLVETSIVLEKTLLNPIVCHNITKTVTNSLVSNSSTKSATNLNKLHNNRALNGSLFGKVLCKKWKTRSTIIKRKTWYIQTSPHITRFDFSEMSPDSKILQYLRKKI